MQSASLDIDKVFAGALNRHRAGDLEDADRLYCQILSADPNHAASLHLRGVIASQTGRRGDAIDLMRKAVAIEPSVAAYHIDLALAFKADAKPQDAVVSYRRGLALTPEAEAYNDLGVLEQQLGRLDEAMASYRRALDLKPGFADAWNNLGSALRDRGRFDDAIAAFKTAIELGVDPCFAYYGLSGCRKFTQADRALVRSMEAMLDDPALSDARQALLYFALGKIHDDLADYAAAIRHFDRANHLERQARQFTGWDFTGFVDWSISAFPKDEPKAPISSDSDTPVFVVGMPRSGTTLVEQILASHPDVAAGGEMAFWLQRLDAIANRPGGGFAPAAKLDAIRDYRDLLRAVAPEARRVVDKMPYNFLLLGLIHRLFPAARIVHCRRNPIDTALSVYFTRFTQILPTQEFAYSRREIVDYYRQYRRLMAHWRSVLPADRFLEIDYEALVADQESVTRTMLDFCGLDWNGACLDFHQTDRPIATASAWQARQPLYRSSTARWRHYEPWLGELMELRDI
jgi:tetratricopeptide (TPR) repeat protein